MLTGTMNKVLTNLTTVAILPASSLQLKAVAIEDAVSFTATPERTPYNWSLNPNILPNTGKNSSANIEYINMVVTDTATSSSSASIMGAVAAMAAPPQIDVPIPINILNLLLTLSPLLTRKLVKIDTLIRAIIITITIGPTSFIILNVKLKPKNTIPVFRK